MEPRFFANPADFRKWLDKNHETEKELWVGFYKVGSGKPSMTWPESVDQALCFGWIDGIRKTIDGESYKIRFTPRKPTSIWSNVNIAKVKDLEAKGLMREAGRKAFAARKEERSGIYSFENETRVLDAESEKAFKANVKAWEFFQAQPTGYRKVALNWVMSAKREETRRKRLGQLIDDSDAGRRLGTFDRNG